MKRSCVIFIPDNFQSLCFTKNALKCSSIAFPIIFYQMQSRNALSLIKVYIFSGHRNDGRIGNINSTDE